MTEVLEAQVGDEVRRWKPYPAYKDSGVDWLGEIPDGWSVAPLKRMVRINPETLPEDTNPGFTFRYVDIGNVDSLGEILQGELVAFDQAPSRARRKVRSGDSIISTVRTYLKAIAWIKEAANDVIVSTGFAVLRPSSGLLPAYLWRVIHSQPFVESVVSHSEGVSYPAITPFELGRLPIWFPAAQEQCAIAEFLDEETAKIDGLRNMKRELIRLQREQLRAQVTRLVAGGEFRSDGVGVWDWRGCLPDGWATLPIKRIASFITSGSRGWAEHYRAEGKIFLRIGNLSRESIDLKLDTVQRVEPPTGAEASRTRARPGDVLLSITAYIGSVSVVPDELEEAYVNQHLSLIRPRQDVCDPRWLANVLWSEIGRQQLRLLLYGGTKDGLGLDDVGAISIPLPPLAQQKQYVAEIAGISERTNRLVQRIQEGVDSLQEYRDTLISAAVTGKIDVRGVA